MLEFPPSLSFAKLFVFKKCIMEPFALIGFLLIRLQNTTVANKKSFSSTQDPINQTSFATGWELPHEQRGSSPVREMGFDVNSGSRNEVFLLLL